ncbi:MAG: amidohydrolase family protein, partial [Dehalococcoidia bacterium]
EHDLCRRHNDYLLEAAAKSGGRLMPFCIVNPLAGERAVQEVARSAASGARGLGELRPANQGYDLARSKAGRLLAELAAEHKLILLFHVTEPGGHDYPGKQGLPLSSFRRFVTANPSIRVVGAHLGGGLPLHARNPGALLNTHVDTAALPFLYDASVLPGAAEAMGGRLLLGSDFPLIAQERQIDLIRSAVNADTAAEILGGAASRLLGL